DRSSRRWPRNDRRSAGTRPRRRHRLRQRGRAPAHHLRGGVPLEAGERGWSGGASPPGGSGGRHSRARGPLAMELRPVVVDDEQLARDELGYLLGRVGGVDVIGQADNGIEALTAIGRLQPDLVFLDVQMPGLTGFEVARRLLDTRAASQIIFVTAYDQH